MIDRILRPALLEAAGESPAVALTGPRQSGKTTLAELDIVVEARERLIGVEVKSGATLAGDFFTALRQLPELAKASDEGRRPVARLIYGGDAGQDRSDTEVIPWSAVQDVCWV